MKEIICDTNIWYGLGNGSIKKPENVKLFATWNNIVEIGFSHPKIKELINVDEVKKAAKAILDYSDDIIEDDPFTYSANKIDDSFDFKTKSLKFILDYIVKNGLPDDNTYSTNKAAYDVFLKMKEVFAENINSEKANIRKRVFANKIDKNKFKVADELQRDEQAYNLLIDIDNFLDKEHQLKITFYNEDDFRKTINNIKNKFELFVFTKQKFLKKWVLDKSMRIDQNDFYDLLNLIYVEKGQFYWTKENRWVTIINEANMDKYLWK